MAQTKFNKRLNAIQELVKTHLIEDQAQLIELLEQKYDIATNQAAISRDLRKLGIHKKFHDERMVYALPEINIETEILRYAIVSVRRNETTIVINTVDGTAAFVGDYLDAQTDLPILGTLAGENVVFVAPFTVTQIEDIYKELCLRLKVKEEK